MVPLTCGSCSIPGDDWKSCIMYVLCRLKDLNVKCGPEMNAYAKCMDYYGYVSYHVIRHWCTKLLCVGLCLCLVYITL